MKATKQCIKKTRAPFAKGSGMKHVRVKKTIRRIPGEREEI